MTGLRSDRFKLRWLGTAGFHIQGPGLDILVDPYLSRPKGANPPPFLEAEEFRNVETILVTHGHFDHAMDVPRIMEVAPQARVLASVGVTRTLLRAGAPADRVQALRDGQQVNVGAGTVTALDTDHTWFDIPLVMKTLRKSVS